MNSAKWLLTTVWAPTTETKAETFIWYRPEPRLQVGLAYLWEQSAVRFLGNYEVVPETANRPNLRVGFGVQGIGTGNPGYFATSEKNFMVGEGRVNAYLGVGFRANEDHGHALGGIKYSRGLWTLGFQHDGHDPHLFTTLALDPNWSAGVYLIDLKSPALMVSYAIR